MHNLSSRFFAHAVLRGVTRSGETSHSDYKPNHRFMMNFKLKHNRDYSIDILVSDARLPPFFEGLIDEGKAKIGIFVHCSPTWYQDTFLQDKTQYQDDIFAKIPKGRVRGQTRLDAFIVTTEKIPNFFDSGMLEGYGPIDLEPGQIVATHHVGDYSLDWGESVKGIFEIEEDPDVTGAYTEFDLENEKVKIRVSSDLYKYWDDSSRDDPARQELREYQLKTEIYLPALMEVMHQMDHENGPYQTNYETLSQSPIYQAFKTKWTEKQLLKNDSDPEKFKTENLINSVWQTAIQLLSEDDTPLYSGLKSSWLTAQGD